MLGAHQKFTVSIPMLALLLIFGSCSDKDQVNGPSVPKYLRGDINNNGIAFEVADAVLFSNYFVYGQIVFSIEQEIQIAATDVNRDGLTLSVADLVYLIRIVVGDALPYPIIIPLDVRYTHDNSGVMSVKDDVQIGAVNLVMAGKASPWPLADNLDMLYAYDGTNTSILLWSCEGNSFTGDFLNVSGEVVSIEMSTDEGQPINAILQVGEFGMGQNKPNPFSGETHIPFWLSPASEVRFEISNYSGQVVFEYSQYYQAGYYTFSWNGTTKYGLAADDGKYFCTMKIYELEKTIEMIKAR